MITTESPEVCLHTAYVVGWEVVTIKQSPHDNNNQCNLRDEVATFNVPKV